MPLSFSDYLTAEELAELKGVSLKAVYGWIHRNIAPPHDLFAGRYFFHKAAASDYTPPRRGPKLKAR